MIRETMSTQHCPACRANLAETSHNPDCQNAPLTKAERDRLFKHRQGKPSKAETVSDTGRVEWEAFQVSPEENLQTIIESPWLTQVTTGLLRELAALVQMASAGRGAQTDREGRYRDVHSPMPSFTPAEAEKRLRESEHRLFQEVDKLSGATRNPHDPQEPQCVECGRRATAVDSFCQPCGAAILKAHRRDS